MAFVSIAPLASRCCVHKSFVSSREVKPLCRTIPTLGRCRRGKTVTPSISMCWTATVLDDGVQRRIANHHSNLWHDSFIQSLSTPYGETSYLERADKLIGEVKEIINSISVEDGELITPLNDLIQRLSIVDNIERLGIDRHFKNEIKSVLDYVYSYWNEKGIGCGRESVITDLNSTALGLRTLRLHGYPVSSDVLEQFKDQNGQFACSAIQTEGEIKSVLNLFRASLIAFPGEKVMEDAEIFSTIYLKEALLTIPVCSLSREIAYVLEHGWHTNLPRLEARNYIDVFGQDPIYGTPNIKMTQKLLEIAKLEFNIFHSLQQKELKHLSRWWKDSVFSQLTFPRHRHVEYYTLASCIDIDPQHSSFRLGFAKISHLGTVLDDIYDTFGTMDELELFTAALKRWHPSATKWLPEYMKGVYMMLYETVNEMAREADKSQGRDTLNYARQAWEAYIDSYMKEAKWISSGFLPTFEEYLDNGKVSFGYRIGTLQPILTLGTPFPHHILQEIDFPSSLNRLACSILRLKGDIHTYQAERSRGEKSSCISCYMKDNPGSTEEDAVTYINAMVNKSLKELNWEFLRPDSNAPITSKKHAFDILRAFYHLYKHRDGFSVARNEIRNLVKTTVIEPVPL
uniref:(R)-linalool synthase 1, chloroplastic n=1 Tax=Picea sitchensis TaxID=3332 RepID=LLOS1_PICSI|nr:RecName: Full=(R)-linalool synthase 1, chloroplastic; AltName: Full=Terpene synthase TPS-Lin 1; Short=PsTPS-Lin-1; Flags: Precursor [Picea sitchensis]ADZ45501.1 (-)-linalool synthase [Picea sitchensis]